MHNKSSIYKRKTENKLAVINYRHQVKMGTTNSKKVDNAGEIVNTIIINPEDIRSENIELILIILTIEVGLSFIYQIYKDYRRGLKKKYTSEAAHV